MLFCFVFSGGGVSALYSCFNVHIFTYCLFFFFVQFFRVLGFLALGQSYRILFVAFSQFPTRFDAEFLVLDTFELVVAATSIDRGLP